jgi:hypothetical protein
MSDTPHRFQDLLARIKREARVKSCFAADSSCSDSIVKAHSIQNNRILARIADNGEVIQLKVDVWDEGFGIAPRRVGRRVASVATNFCGEHDTKIFLPIEGRNYAPGDLEQEFLFAYRSFARDYHAKLEQINMLRATRDKFDTFEAKEYLNTALLASETTLREMEVNRLRLNQARSSSDFKQIYTYRAEFCKPCPIAVSSCFAPELDLNGNVVNSLGDLNTSLNYLMLTVFPQESKTHALISCFRKDKKDLTFVPKQILSRTKAEQKVIMSNMILAYIENLFISPAWWGDKPSATQEAICKIFCKTITSGNKIFENMADLNLLE